MVHGELCPDGFGSGCPDEGLRALVGCGDVAGDRLFEVIDGAEDAPFQALAGELGEKAFDGVEPRARGRREVERPSRMCREPGQHLGVLVGGVVVEDGVNDLARAARIARRSR